jgi:glycosyltransferase involved in cell wall biosynthesis
MTKLHVLVVLQTHSKGDNQHYLGFTTEPRFCNAPKAEVTRRCTRSLVESLNHAKNIFSDSYFELIVYDDHSDEQTITDIKNNLDIANFKTEFISLDTYGIMPSILKCYEHGRDHGKEIVYFAQDDYLYDTTAISDMIYTMIEASTNLNKFASIYPFNDPYRYIPQNTSALSHIIRSQKRHWRTSIATASCFMVHHQMLIKNWDLFEAMGKHVVCREMEDNTINKLWTQRGYYLFVPIPSLALHMQYNTEMDDQINWREWWDRYDIQKH